ncbi:hypothetical protein ABMA28_010977 [Loxostege sticticalis]|uniref:MADF domain-containing protein n=1 Tax=Loxostege sticticalis TaxID=481309 RepID=A0ABD0S800_LOXSC
MARWLPDHAANIKFVQEVEKYPCLYNWFIPEYVRKDLTEQAWSDIGKKFKLTGSECKERWKNLRSVFVRNLKHRKGAHGAKKPYYLSQFMQFALPYIKFPKRKGDIQESFTNEHSSQAILPDEETQPIDDIPSTSPSYSPFEPETPVEFMATSKHQTPRNAKRDRSEQLNTEQVISAYFKMKHSRMLEDSNHEQTSNKMFLLSILPDMNKMTEKRKREFKQRLLRLVDEFLDEDSDSNCGLVVCETGL